MTMHRLIPVVLLRDGAVVQSKLFRRYQCLGGPVEIVKRLSAWASDELILLDIGQSSTYSATRRDTAGAPITSYTDVLAHVARHCFMPLTFGGHVCCLDDALLRLRGGADKIAINTMALQRPDLIDELALEFGSQCVVVSVDVREQPGGGWRVFGAGGSHDSGRDVVEWVAECEQRGAGEILLNAIHRDGTGLGYDLALVRAVVERVRVPVIALGGVGHWDHLIEGVQQGGASAVAAANIFNYRENSVLLAKEYMYGRGVNVRPPESLEAEFER